LLFVKGIDMGEQGDDVQNESGDSWNWQPESGRLLRPPRRFPGTFLAIFLILSAPCITAIWMLIVPEYTARAEVRVRPIIPRVIFNTEDNGPIPLYQSFMNTQVSIMRSPSVLQRVLEQKKVLNTKWYKGYKDPVMSLMKSQKLPVMRRLRDGLSASPCPDSELIDVSFTARSAHDAATIVNAALDQYIAYISDASTRTRDTIYLQLSKRYKALEKEIEGREEVLATLRQELGTGVPEELVAMKRIALEEAESKYRRVFLDREVGKWRQMRLESAIKAEARKKSETKAKEAPVAAPTTQPAEIQPKYHGDGEWRRLDMQVRSLRHQIGLAGKDSKTGDRTKVKLAGELKFAEEMLALRQAQLDEDWANRSKPVALRLVTVSPILLAMKTRRPQPTHELKLQTVKAEVKLLTYQSGLLFKQVEKQRKEFAATFANAQRLEKENDELRHKRRLFDAVRERLDAKYMERNVPGPISVLTRAIASSEPSRDPRVPLTVLVLLAASVVGATFGFIRSRRMSSRYRISDIGALPETPFLGKLPLVRGCRRNKPKASADDQDLLDGVRIVSTAILTHVDEKPGRIVLVTSPDAEAGRSSVAILLAKNLARCGVKVLLVDADMRNGTLSRTFGLQQGPGVADSLCANDPMAQKRTYEGEIANLHIMPVGPRGCRRGVEQVVRGGFAKCMERYRDDYDIILVDGPPVIPVADARVLARQTDGAILVVREGRTRRVDVSNALASLRSAGSRVLGVLLIGYACTEIRQEQRSASG